MKPRDIFKIVVATIGLIIVCLGTINIISATVSMTASASMSASSSLYGRSFGLSAAIVGVEIAFGILIMKGFPPFVDIAFPSTSTHSEEEEEEEEEEESSTAETGPACVACGKRMPQDS